MITEEILKGLEKIRAGEKKALEFYREQMKVFHDDSVLKMIKYLTSEEERHVKTADDLLEIVKGYKPDEATTKDFLADFTETSTFLLTLNLKNYQKVNTSVLKHLINKRGMTCLYLAVNKPCSSIIQLLRKAGVNDKKVFFVDCSSVAMEHEHPVVAPQNLTELSLTLNDHLAKIRGPKFLHVDAVSAFYVFNKSDVVESFIHALVRKLKDKKIGLTLVAIKEEGDERALTRLKTFVDKQLER